MDRVVFILYVAGSYGSFLSHCVNFSDDLYNSKFKTIKIFDKLNTAHLNIREYIYKFHNSDDLLLWNSLDDTASAEYITKYWKGLPEDAGTSMFTQRCAMPNVHEKLKRFFPESKFVNICFDDDDIPVISELHAKKTLRGYVLSRAVHNREEYDYLRTLSPEDKFNHYYQVCLDFKRRLPRVRNVPYMFDFEFKWFYNKQKFINNYIEMCDFLGIKSGDVAMLYDEFANINNIKA
jgi:hypothetical protein